MVIVFGYSDGAIILDEASLRFILDPFKYMPRGTELTWPTIESWLSLAAIDDSMSAHIGGRYRSHKCVGSRGSAQIRVSAPGHKPMVTKRVTLITTRQVMDAIESVGVWGTTGHHLFGPVRPATDADIAGILLILSDPT